MYLRANRRNVQGAGHPHVVSTTSIQLVKPELLHNLPSQMKATRRGLFYSVSQKGLVLIAYGGLT
jgi:hypothetical protein